MYITEIYRPYNNSYFINPEKYSYFYYDKNNWIINYKSKDYISNETPEMFYNYINYIKK